MKSENCLGKRTGVGFIVILLVTLSLSALTAKEAKLKPEELVAKHLESIGTAEARAAAKNRVASGAVQFIIRLPTAGQLGGPAAVISEGKRMRLAMTFKALDYPSEQLAFDGGRVNVSYIQPGRRSESGGFFYQYDVLLREGLLGGTMTTAWALLDVPGRQPKLEYNGLKKVEGKQLHELRYRAKKGSGDLNITLHFESESFRHVHSEYKLVQPAGMAATPTESSSQRETIYHIDEWFEDFRAIDSLNLPHVYKLTYSREGQGPATLLDYKIVLSKILHNQALEASAFAIQ